MQINLEQQHEDSKRKRGRLTGEINKETARKNEKRGGCFHRAVIISAVKREVKTALT